VLEILVDSHERYPWAFARRQAVTERRALPAGDYAVEADGAVIAAVERKSLADLVATLTSGKARYVLADLAALPRAAATAPTTTAARACHRSDRRPRLVSRTRGSSPAPNRSRRR
jgi:ERCC4 domain